VDEKIFLSPDEAIRKGDMVRFPIWPPSKYLVRISHEKPAEVLKVILSVPPTENPRIHDDFVEAALKMPASISVKLVKKVAEWLSNPYQLLYYRKVSSLIVHLKNGGFADDSLKLSDAVLSMKKKSQELTDGISYEKAKPLVGGDWEYGECIKEIAPIYSGEEKLKFIFLLNQKLKDVIYIEERTTQKLDFVDYSHIWRGSIEDSNQNNDFGVKDTLITWIRDLSEQLASEDAKFAEKLVSALLAQEEPIFSRIALHLGRSIQSPSLTRDLLFNERIFDAMDTWHEYSLLLQSGFPQLKEDDQKSLLQKINTYTPFSEEKSTLTETEERHLRLSRYHYLYMIKGSLDGNDLKIFDDLNAEFGEVENPTFSSYSSSWIGPTSPISYSDFEKMSSEEIATYLASWRPGNDFARGPSVEGLGREFQNYVKVNSKKVVNGIDRFRLAEARYVNSVIDGLGEAISQGDELDWKPVIEYLAWATFEAESKLKGNEDNFYFWRWTFVSVCRLIQKSFAKAKQSIDLSFKDIVWKIIKTSILFVDSKTSEENGDLEKINFYHLAINCSRGVAIETAVQFSEWHRDHLKNEKKEYAYADFPDFFDTLSIFSDPSKETSKAVHSVYGRWAPWLYTLDKKWFNSIIKNIFPTDPKLKDFWWAAWSAYITYCSPYDNMLPVLEDNYGHAITLIGEIKSDSAENSSERVVEHIILFYLRGIVELDSPLFKSMYQKIDVSLRGHIIEFIGRGLISEKSKLDNEMIDRAKALWSLRVEECKAMGTVDERRELEDFNWWMGTKYYSEEWLLDQAILALELCHNVKLDYTFMGRLVGLTDKFPAKVVKVIELLVDYVINDNGSYVFSDKATIILKKLLMTESSKAAVDVINKLGAFGFSQFLELLS
jgi:hypothetical protein